MAAMYDRRHQNMHEEESIYNLIPRPREEVVQPPRHHSKFTSKAKDEYKQNKMGSKTMGPAKVQTNRPQSYLKKNSKQPKLPEKKDFKYDDQIDRKPPVPSHTEKALLGDKSNKNFITANAVQNILSVPKKPAANFADTRKGATHPLDPSGLTPKYINKKKYGEVPTYLERRKEEVDKAQREYDAYIEDSFKMGAMHCLSDGERQDIIRGLKKNWEEIHHQYQGLSVVTDTAPKKNKKERMEAEMNQLEKDIDLLEKHFRIYINSGHHTRR